MPAAVCAAESAARLLEVILDLAAGVLACGCRHRDDVAAYPRRIDGKRRRVRCRRRVVGEGGLKEHGLGNGRALRRAVADHVALAVGLRGRDVAVVAGNQQAVDSGAVFAHPEIDRVHTGRINGEGALLHPMIDVPGAPGLVIAPAGGMHVIAQVVRVGVGIGAVSPDPDPVVAGLGEIDEVIHPRRLDVVVYAVVFAAGGNHHRARTEVACRARVELPFVAIDAGRFAAIVLGLDHGQAGGVGGLGIDLVRGLPGQPGDGRRVGHVA